MKKILISFAFAALFYSAASAQLPPTQYQLCRCGQPEPGVYTLNECCVFFRGTGYSWPGGTWDKTGAGCTLPAAHVYTLNTTWRSPQDPEIWLPLGSYPDCDTVCRDKWQDILSDFGSQCAGSYTSALQGKTCNTSFQPCILALGSGSSYIQTTYLSWPEKCVGTNGASGYYDNDCSNGCDLYDVNEYIPGSGNYCCLDQNYNRSWCSGNSYDRPTLKQGGQNKWDCHCSLGYTTLSCP